MSKATFMRQPTYTDTDGTTRTRLYDVQYIAKGTALRPTEDLGKGLTQTWRATRNCYAVVDLTGKVVKRRGQYMLYSTSGDAWNKAWELEHEFDTNKETK